MKKVLVTVLAASMLMLSACSSSDTSATATVSPTATETTASKITVDNDNSTFSYVKDVTTDTGYNISNALMTPNNLIVADDNYLYYVKADTNGNTHLYRSDKEGKNEILLIDNCGGNLNLVGSYIIYSGQDLYDVYKYNISTKQTTRIFIGIYDTVYVAKNIVYMSNSLKGLISCDMNGSNYQIISKKNTYLAGYDSGYLYFSYVDNDSGVINLSRIKVGQTTVEVVLSDSSITPLLVKDGKAVCLTTDSDTSSYVFEIYSIADKKVTDTILSFDPNSYGLNSFSMTGGTIYFSFQEEVETEAAATDSAIATAAATATTSTVDVNNLYAYDMNSKKLYNLGNTENTIIMFAGSDAYTVKGTTDSSGSYTDITTLDKLIFNGNKVTEQSIISE